MKFLANLTQKQYLLVALFFLAVGNLLVWGIRVVESVPSNPLYSTGTTFASDGTGPATELLIDGGRAKNMRFAAVKR